MRPGCEPRLIGSSGRQCVGHSGLAGNSCCSGGGQNGGLEGIVGNNLASRRVRKLADASQSPMARLNDIFGPVERSVRRK